MQEHMESNRLPVPSARELLSPTDLAEFLGLADGVPPGASYVGLQLALHIIQTSSLQNAAQIQVSRRGLALALDAFSKIFRRKRPVPVQWAS